MSDGEAIGPLGLRIGQSATRTKVITDGDLIAYAQITGDYNPLHFDDAFAAGTRFGRRVAQGGIADTLTARVEVVDLKPAKPVCQLKFEIRNQDGTVVLEAEAWTYTLRPAIS